MTQNRLSPILLASCLFALGAGQGAVGVPSISAAYVSVPKEQLAFASTASNIVQRLGGPIGTTIIGIILSLSATQFPVPHVPSSNPRVFMMAFIALIGFQFILLGSASRLPIRIHRNSRH
jgi:hypothetical protein